MPKLILVISTLALLLAGCSEERNFVKEQEISGFTVQIEIKDLDANQDYKQFTNRAFETFKSYTLPFLEQGNELDVLNTERSLNNMSSEFSKLLELGQQYFEATNKLWDPFQGEARKLWDLDSPLPSAPDSDALIAAVDRAQETELYINRSDRSHLSGAGLFDPGLMGVGLAVDATAQVLIEAGVSIGQVRVGDITRSWGQPEVGRDLKSYWHFMLDSPIDDSTKFQVTAPDGAVVSISVDKQGFMFRDRAHHRILDPDTGLPIAEPYGCIVWADEASKAMAYGEALLLMGVSGGLEWVHAQENVGIMYLYEEDGNFIAEGDPTISPWLESIIP